MHLGLEEGCVSIGRPMHTADLMPGGVMMGRGDGLAPSGRRLVIVGCLSTLPPFRLPAPTRRLLAYLAIQYHPVARGIAAAELWPDVADEVGRANLRRALWQAPAGWICSIGDELAVNADIDLGRARDAAERALSGEALTLGEIKLLSNDILPGWHEEWVIRAQDSFRLLSSTLAIQAA
jgi:DNA-binding SARP family transcriptional activator